MDLSVLAGPWADYDIDRLNPPRPEVVEGYRVASRAAGAPRMLLGEPYGPHERERIDYLAPEARRSPAVVFLHGGYWRGGAREDRRFPASFFVPRGVAWISVGYPLTATTPLSGIVESVRRALIQIHREGHEAGIDTSRLVLAGNSAGAHLAAMMLLTDWAAAGRPGLKPRGAALISGLYDLAPYPDYELGRASGITRENCAGLSPLRIRRTLDVPVALGVGEAEPSKFRLQSALMAEHLAALGAKVERIPGAGHDHFSIIGEFGRDGPLARALLKMAA